MLLNLEKLVGSAWIKEMFLPIFSGAIPFL